MRILAACVFKELVHPGHQIHDHGVVHYYYSNTSLNDGSYVLKKVSLGNFVIVWTSYSSVVTNLDGVAYYKHRPMGTTS